MIPFIAKYYLCDQFKTDETNEAHRTSREEVKYVKILVGKPQGINPFLRSGIDKRINPLALELDI
jgi:hypothetical protein